MGLKLFVYYASHEGDYLFGGQVLDGHAKEVVKGV